MMKKQLFLVTLLMSLGLQAQNFSGQAFYQSKTTVDMDNFGREGISEEMKKQIMARMKSFLEKTYILTFSGSESIYEEEAALEVEGQRGGMAIVMASASPGVQYKNLDQSALVQAQEFFGKSFLIKDEIPALDWEVTNETKMIGAYMAIKARAVKQVKANDFGMMRRRDRRSEDKASKEPQKSDSLKTDPMDEIELPNTIEVTAWFTPQIPVGHGPGEYAGLPGLILELNADRTTLLCSKIVMNPKDLPAISPPDKGTVVTQDEFETIVKEKTQEMRDNWRNRSGRRGRGE